MNRPTAEVDLAPLIRLGTPPTDLVLIHAANLLQHLMVTEGLVHPDELQAKSARARWVRLVNVLLELNLIDRAAAIESISTALEISDQGADAVLDHLADELPVN